MHTYIKTKSLCTDSDLEVDTNILIPFRKLGAGRWPEGHIQDPNPCKDIWLARIILELFV